MLEAFLQSGRLVFYIIITQSARSCLFKIMLLHGHVKSQGRVLVFARRESHWNIQQTPGKDDMRLFQSVETPKR